MNKTEVAQLLTVVSVYDHRTVGDSDVEAWYLIIRNVEADDAMQAAIDHYTTRTDWLMPAHIIERAKELARRREGQRRRAELDAELEAEGITAIDAEPPAEPPKDWAELGAELKRRGAPELSSPPKVDRRHDATKLDEARRELAEARQHAGANKRPDAGNAAREACGSAGPARPHGASQPMKPVGG